MAKSIKFAVVLSGCGVYDGAEIHESVLSLLAIVKNGGVYEIFAPDIDQMHVVDHTSGQEMEETRNVFIESARIARGNIKKMSEFIPDNFDILFFPGGFGGAKNLSDYALKGHNLTVNPQIEEAIKGMRAQQKPIGSICITPVIMAKVLGDVKLTIGKDESTAQHVEILGANHVNTTFGEIVTDRKNKLVTAPCYMLDAKITDIEKETDLVVKALISLM